MRIMRRSISSPTARSKHLCAAGFALMLALGCASLFAGKYPLRIGAILAGDETQIRVFWSLRFARTMLGAVGGFVVAYELDQRYIRYDTSGCWWVQLLKLVLGLGLSLGIKELAYLALDFLPGELLHRMIAYFLLVIFAGAIWPLTFPFFRRLEKNK